MYKKTQLILYIEFFLTPKKLDVKKNPAFFVHRVHFFRFFIIFWGEKFFWTVSFTV